LPHRLTVRSLRPEEEAAYDTRLATWPGALIYGSRRFANFLEEVAGCKVCHFVAERRGAIVGSLPFALKAGRDGREVVNSLPWFGSHGGCWLADADDGEAREVLLSSYAAELGIRTPLFAVTVLSPAEEAHTECYCRQLGQTPKDRRIGQISELPAWCDDYEDVLLGMMRQKTRNLVRKSGRQGLAERVGDHDASWEFLYQTHRENMMAISGTPKPREHFDALRRHFTTGASRLSVAYLDGQPVAGLLLLKFAHTIEYFVPVVASAFRAMQPLSFLIRNAMLDCARENYRFWNWGGTWPSQKSLHHFKAGWGALDRPYSYLVRARDDALSRLRSNPDGLKEEFPYFYLFPMSKLDARNSA